MKDVVKIPTINNGGFLLLNRFEEDREHLVLEDRINFNKLVEVVTTEHPLSGAKDRFPLYLIGYQGSSIVGVRSVDDNTNYAVGEVSRLPFRVIESIRVSHECDNNY